MAINTDYIEKENDQKLDELEKNLEKTVTIAVVGKVSAGKSSLLNALFNKSKNEQLATVGAISGEVKNPHTIDKSKCIKCGACMEKCRFGAIYKE